MESHSYLYHTGNPGNEPKACWESKKRNVFQGTSAKKEFHEVESEEKSCSSRESAKTLVPDTEPISSSTATSRIPTMHSGTAVTASTPATTILASKQHALSHSSTTFAGLSRSKSRSPNMSQNLKTQNISSSSKNIHKTATSSERPKIIHKISSADSPRSRTSLSHIPRATSGPKLKPSASLREDKTEPDVPKGRRNESESLGTDPAGSRNEMIDDVRKTHDDVALQGTQDGLVGNDLITLNTIGCKGDLPLKNEKQPSNPSTPEDKSHANVATRERQHDMEKERTERRKEAEVKKNTAMTEKNETKKVNDAEMTTVETHDAALQTDRLLMSVDAEVQVFVEVCDKSTGTSPVRQTGAQLTTLVGAKPRFLGPRPYKSPNIRNPVQHVCQIEIELSSQSEGVAEQKNSEQTKGEKEENVTPQDIVWDEQGMTWEVYGASLDTESLGFAIQNHLQCKIREHERRIRTLRRSICLSERSPGRSETGKRNALRSLFGGSKCCLKTQP